MQYLIKRKGLVLDVIIGMGLVLAFFIFRKNLSNVIAPFVYGLVVSYLLNPAVNFLERKKIKRPLAILMVFVMIFLIISLVFMSFVPTLGNDVSVFVSELPNIFGFLERVIGEIQAGEITFVPEAWLGFIDFDQELARVSELVKQWFGQISTAILASTGTLLNIIMTPIITFYYLNDKKKILGAIKGWIPQRVENDLLGILKEVDLVLGGFIKGQLMVASFVGVLTGIGCAVIGVPYALTIGLVAGLTNIIPYFGPWIGGILPVVLALMHQPITALWVVIWILIVQQIESSFISPQVMSHSVGLHPLTVMFSVLFFGNVFGIVGMIIGVPLTGTIKVLSKYAIAYRKRLKKEQMVLVESSANQ